MRKIKASKKSKMNVFFIVILTVLILYTVLMFGLFLMGINISLKHMGDVMGDGNIFGTKVVDEFG